MKNTEWGEGTWDHEPDDLNWTDEDTGYACAIRRHISMGHLCGYVGVPFEVEFPEERLRVHGGITYNGSGAGVTLGGGLNWYGFDCAHAGDVSPGMHKMLKGLKSPMRMYLSKETYKPYGYVIWEVMGLAKQLKEYE